MKTAYIYKITSPTGRIYVGQTSRLSDRVSAYRNCNMNRQEILKNSILKHGWDKHNFEVIEECTTDTVNEREIYWIQELQSYYYANSLGMNMTFGGGGCRGRKDTNEVKKKRALSNTGRKHTEKSKQLISFSKKGKVKPRLGILHREDTKLKISAAKTGVKQTADTVTARVQSMKENFLKNYGGVLQIDPNTNKIVNEWINTVKEISKLNGWADSHIIKCLKNKTATAYGFIWKYKYTT
jgi:group I intron endonuclease